MKIGAILDKGSMKSTLRSKEEKRKLNEVQGGHVDYLGKNDLGRRSSSCQHHATGLYLLH